jgi:carbon-monoxide dehydrogenase medium subunit
VISAKPAGDGAIPLMALGAEIRVTSKAGERWLFIEEAYRGIGLSSVDASSQVVTEVKFKKLGEKGRTRFFRMARRKALALPMLNGAVVILFDSSSNRAEEARIALGPVAERPFRPRNAEAYLQSMKISPEVILEASRIASEEAKPRTSFLRGSDTYRRQMIRLHLGRTIKELLGE